MLVLYACIPGVNALFLQTRSLWINRILRRLLCLRVFFTLPFPVLTLSFLLYMRVSKSTFTLRHGVRSSHSSSIAYLNPVCLSYFVGTCSYDTLIKMEKFFSLAIWLLWQWLLLLLSVKFLVVLHSRTHTHIHNRDCKINIRAAIQNNNNKSCR